MNIVLFLIGSVCALLGFIGIFIPIWPTTPFLIIASLCYVRSSEKAYQYLYHHKHFGAYLQHYYTKQGILRKEKIKAYIFLWISISISLFLTKSSVMNIMLIGILLCVTIHIMCIKTREAK